MTSHLVMGRATGPKADSGFIRLVTGAEISVRGLVPIACKDYCNVLCNVLGLSLIHISEPTRPY